MKRILLSLTTLGVVASVAVFATGAFFSDSETSTGNTFVAGDIDLQIDNQSYAIDWNIPGYDDPIGAFVASDHTSWQLADLTVEKFFDFVDLKPGDYGEDTISVHVGSNDAWVCAAAQITDDNDNTYVDPELEDDATVVLGSPETTDGELDEEVKFVFWVDDGDNVYEDGESIFLQGPLSGLGQQGQIALADSSGSILGGNNPIPGGDTFYIGKYWCFGDITENAASPGDGSPIDRQQTGFTCDGVNVNNAAQTDMVVGDLEFYAVQHRNNPDFLCSQWTPDFPVSRAPVGAALTEYVQASTCDITVDDDQTANYNTIQEAIDNASEDSTICVGPGTYNEDVDIDVQGLTLSGDGASATSVINGVVTGFGGAVAIMADNVTLEGFEINGAGQQAVLITTGISGATVQHNKITAASGNNALLTQGSQSNHVIKHNVLTGVDSNQIAYVNGDVSLAGQPSTGVNFYNNTFNGTIVSGGEALGTEATTSNVERNIFSDTISSTYAWIETWKDSVVFHENNFNGAIAEVKLRNGSGSSVDAEDNWWGDTDPSDNVAGTVDYDPYAMSPYPQN